MSWRRTRSVRSTLLEPVAVDEPEALAIRALAVARAQGDVVAIAAHA